MGRARAHRISRDVDRIIEAGARAGRRARRKLRKEDAIERIRKCGIAKDLREYPIEVEPYRPARPLIRNGDDPHWPPTVLVDADGLVLMDAVEYLYSNEKHGVPLDPWPSPDDET